MKKVFNHSGYGRSVIRSIPAYEKKQAGALPACLGQVVKIHTLLYDSASTAVCGSVITALGPVVSNMNPP